jgi:hypothetical protein
VKLHPALRVLAWLFSWLVPKDQREPLMGDLAEEYALRASADSSSAPLKWYLKQICASIPPLLWARLTRSAWLSTLGVGVLAYFAVGVVDFAIKRVIPNWTSDGTFAPDPLGLIVTFPMVVLIGYVAERFRRRAGIVLGAMLLVAIAAMMLSTNASPHLAYQIAYLFVVPAAAFIGGALRGTSQA